MSRLVKKKRQANFKDFKRFGAFKELVEQKKRIQLVRVSIGLFWHSWAFKTRVKRGPLVPKNPNLHKNLSNKLLLFFLRQLI
jgi:hypothetical protein